MGANAPAVLETTGAPVKRAVFVRFLLAERIQVKIELVPFAYNLIPSLLCDAVLGRVTRVTDALPATGLHISLDRHGVVYYILGNLGVPFFAVTPADVLVK
jgi:hypothetical protein